MVVRIPTTTTTPAWIRCVGLSMLLLLWLTLLGTHPAAESDVAANHGETKQESGASLDTQQQEQPQQQQCNETDETCKIRIVTVDELATKKGEDGGKELWLSILGRVYNVTKGPGQFSY